MQSICRRGRVDVEIADGTLTVLEAGEQGCNINPVIVVDRMPDSHIVDDEVVQAYELAEARYVAHPGRLPGVEVVADHVHAERVALHEGPLRALGSRVLGNRRQRKGRAGDDQRCLHATATQLPVC